MKQSQLIDLIIQAPWIIPIEPANCVLENHAIVIDKGQIKAIMPQHLVTHNYEAQTIHNLTEQVLLPGFINAHCHAAMTLMRGFADDYPLTDWLKDHIWPIEAKFVNADFVNHGAELAIAEMLLSGITCFSDMYFFPEHCATAAEKSGIKAQIAFPIFNMPSAWGNNANDYIHKGLDLYDRFRNHPQISIAFGPHAPYTNDLNTLKRVATLSAELDCCVQIHLHETVAEVSDYLAQYNRTPIQQLNDIGLLSHKLQCVHAIHLNDNDINLLKENEAHVIHCPESNLKLASGFCPIYKLQQQNINIALGTDGAASNNDLDLLGEMRTASLLAKAVSQNPSAITAHQALQMATLNGAKAIGIDQQTGSLAAGKSADIIAIDLSKIEQQPIYDIASQIVYSSQRQQVKNVWINGKLLLNDRKLKTLDTSQIRKNTDYWKSKLVAAK